MNLGLSVKTQIWTLDDRPTGAWVEKGRKWAERTGQTEEGEKEEEMGVGREEAGPSHLPFLAHLQPHPQSLPSALGVGCKTG